MTSDLWIKSDRQTFGLLNEFCCHDFRTAEGAQRGWGGPVDHQGALVFVFRWRIPGLGKKLEFSLPFHLSCFPYQHWVLPNFCPIWFIKPSWMNGFSCSVVSLCDPMDHSLPGPSVHGILQARTLEWIAIPFSRGSSQPRDRTWVSCIAGRFFTDWNTRTSTLNKALLQRNLLAEGLNLSHLHVLNTSVLEKETLI